MKPTDDIRKGYCLTVQYLKNLQNQNGDKVYLPKDYTKKLSKFEQKQALLLLQKQGVISYEVEHEPKEPGTSFALRTAKIRIAGWNIHLEESLDEIYRECESEQGEKKLRKDQDGNFYYKGKLLKFNPTTKYGMLLDMLYSAPGRSLTLDEIIDQYRKRGKKVSGTKYRFVTNGLNDFYRSVRIDGQRLGDYLESVREEKFIDSYKVGRSTKGYKIIE
jgi:hypothetical protein